MVDVEFALQVMLVGFSLVLFTLFMLYLVIIILGRFFAPEISAVPESISTAREVPVTDGLTAQKAAVVSTAVYAYLYESPSDYIIKKIEPVQVKHIDRWASEGRRELLKMNQEIEKLRREKSGKKIF